jgi:hypothetical protein
MSSACYYMRPFNLTLENSRSALGTLILRHTGQTNIVVDIAQLSADDATSVASNWFWHYFYATTFVVTGHDRAATTRYPHFATISLGQALNVYVQAQQTLLGWPESDFAATWEETTFGDPLPYYAFQNGSAFTYQFSTAAGAALFGAPGTSLSSSAAFHALLTRVPNYVVFPSVQNVSPTGELDAHYYEPEGIASAVVSDSGMVYGNARLTGYVHCDWQQKFETIEKVMRIRALSAHPYTFQHLFEDCRSHTPFCVAHGHGASPAYQYPVFALRGDGNAFRPRSASLANHYQTHLDFRTIAVGSLQTPT